MLIGLCRLTVNVYVCIGILRCSGAHSLRSNPSNQTVPLLMIVLPDTTVGTGDMVTTVARMRERTAEVEGQVTVEEEVTMTSIIMTVIREDVSMYSAGSNYN